VWVVPKAHEAGSEKRIGVNIEQLTPDVGSAGERHVSAHARDNPIRNANIQSSAKNPTNPISAYRPRALIRR